MTPIVFRIACAVGVLVFASESAAQSVIYPAKGQSAAQQSKDEGECQTWAKNNTGVDPLALANQAAQPAPVSAAPQQGGETSRARGAVKGAAAGAAVGAVAGDAGKGAATGAAMGTVAAGSRKRRGERAAAGATQQQQQTQSANTQAQLDKFNKTSSACLEGRG